MQAFRLINIFFMVWTLYFDIIVSNFYNVYLTHERVSKIIIKYSHENLNPYLTQPSDMLKIN